MRLGIVSDTHGQVNFTREAVRMLESLEVDEVIHCGDIGSVEIVPLLATWPAHFVLGNVDDNEAALRTAIEQCGGNFHGRFGSLQREGARLAFLHGDDARRLRETTTSGDWDLVCYGHTHVAGQHYEGRTLVLNPGAVYRANPHSIAVVDLPELEATNIPL